MALSDLTVEAVTAAVDEFDALGRESFLDKYGFGEAKDYYVVRNGIAYDSKAIAGAAHGYLPGREALRSGDFTGGAASVVKRLRALGFRVPPNRAPTWVRDELILACDLVVQNEWRVVAAEDPRVIELSALLQSLPFHPPETRSLTFRNPNGVERKTGDLVSNHPDYKGTPTNAGATDRQVLGEFIEDPAKMHRIALRIREAAESSPDEVPFLSPEVQEDEGAVEGRLLQRVHYTRERDPKLRQRKIDSFLRSHDRVHCELCEFDFEARYGERGRDFIEVHHVVPLHESGPTFNKLADLILVCSNCHRMIHRGTPWLAPDEVRDLIG
ncbi:HNH endonuclease [Dietzia maris]|uniref:HNH endonuclease n=1 Tax=Dietzia maris TaxID=37915 RepID=A0AAE4TZD9_9ACTN|nr:HNH endonuclease [Dietzia maris]MDV6298995.1 HNH endonuclease [Dietzia maris]